MVEEDVAGAPPASSSSGGSAPPRVSVRLYEWQWHPVGGIVARATVAVKDAATCVAIAIQRWCRQPVAATTVAVCRLSLLSQHCRFRPRRRRTLRTFVIRPPTCSCFWQRCGTTR